MSEFNVAARQPGNTAPQPATTQNLSQPQIDQNEFARLQREAERAKGMQGYFNAGNQYGIKTPEQLREVGELYQTMSSQGIKPSQMAQMFGSQVASQSNGSPENLTKADIEAIVGERLSKAQADMIRGAAQKEHDSAIDSEYNEFVPEKLKSALGEDANEALVELARYAAIGKYSEHRNQYGEDHPLKGMYGPAGKDGLGQIMGWLKESATKLKASQSLALGAAARKTSASTPGGNGANQGQPSQSSGRPGGLPSREQLEAFAAQLRAKRGQ
jgi:hypothetical protein